MKLRLLTSRELLAMMLLAAIMAAIGLPGWQNSGYWKQRRDWAAAIATLKQDEKRMTPDAFRIRLHHYTCVPRHRLPQRWQKLMQTPVEELAQPRPAFESR